MVEDWIAMNYNHLKKRFSVIKSPDWDDIYHEVLISFMVMDPHKTEALIENEEAEKYLKQMFYLNCISETAPYKRKYKHNKTTQQDEFVDEETDISSELCWGDFETIMWEVDAFFVDKHLYKEYIEKKIITPSYSIKKMSEDSMVPYPTLNVKFNNIRRQMEIEMKKIIDDNDKARND